MAIERTIDIDGRQVNLKASAAVPRLYRDKFQRDIFIDFSEIGKEKSGISEKEFFENAAYIMAKHADPQSVPEEISKWLEEFSFMAFAKISVKQAIMEMWNDNRTQTAESKKKSDQSTEK